jgi:hypothetical protein
MLTATAHITHHSRLLFAFSSSGTIFGIALNMWLATVVTSPDRH